MEDKRDKDDKVSGGMQEIVETSTREVGMGETKKRKSKGRGWEKEGRKGENNGSKESNGGMGNIGERERSGKVRSRDKEVGTGEIS